MLGIPVEGPVNMFIDNDSVIKNSTIPESILKKKNTSVAYHHIREAVPGKWIRLAHVKGTANLVDMLTKSLPANILHGLCGHIF